MALLKPWLWSPMWVENERKRRALYEAQTAVQPYMRSGKPADLEIAQQLFGSKVAQSTQTVSPQSFVRSLLQQNAADVVARAQKNQPLTTPPPQQPAPQPAKSSGGGGGFLGGLKDLAGNAGSAALGSLEATADIARGNPSGALSDLKKGFGAGASNAQTALGAPTEYVGKPIAGIVTGGAYAGQHPILDANGNPTGQYYRDKPDFWDVIEGFKSAATQNPVTTYQEARAGEQQRLANPALAADPVGRAALTTAMDPTLYAGPGLLKAAIPGKAGEIAAHVIGNDRVVSGSALVGSVVGAGVGQKLGGQTGAGIGQFAGGLIGGFAPATTNLVRAVTSGAFTGDARQLGNRLVEDQGAGNALIEQMKVDLGLRKGPLSANEQRALARLTVPDTGYQPSFAEAVPASSPLTGAPVKWTTAGEIPGVGKTGYAEYFGAGSHGFEQPAIFVNDAIMSQPPSDPRDMLIRLRMFPHEEAHSLWDQTMTPMQRDQVTKLLYTGDRNAARAVRQDLATRWPGQEFDPAQEAFAEAWASRQSGQETPYSRLLAPVVDQVIGDLSPEQRQYIAAQRRQIKDWTPQLSQMMDVIAQGVNDVVPDRSTSQPWYWVRNPSGENAGFITQTADGRYEVGLRTGDRRTFATLQEAQQYAVRARNLMPFQKGAAPTPDSEPRRTIPDSTAIGMSGDLQTEDMGGGLTAVINQGKRVALLTPGPDGRLYISSVDGGPKFMSGTYAGSMNDALDFIAKRAPVPPQPLARERIWWHGTKDNTYDVPDPEKATARITQGPGVYMAADPTTSANYGHRLFANEFDGNVLDLTAPASIDAPMFEGGPTWQQYADSVAEKLTNNGVPASGQDLLSPRNADLSPFTKAQLRTPNNGYGWRDRIAGNAQALIDAQVRELSTGDARRLGGRFGTSESNIELTKMLINDQFADNGVDALFHHSPNADGDVLIVLNGKAARTRADIQPPDAYAHRNSTLDEIKSYYDQFGKGTVTQQGEDFALIRAAGGQWEATQMAPGQWSLSDPMDNIVATFPTKEEAIAYVTEGKYQRFFQAGQTDPTKPTFVGMQPSEIADILGVPQQNKALYDRLTALDEKFRLGTLTPKEATERAQMSTTLRDYYSRLNDGRSPVWVLPAGTREMWAQNVQQRVQAMKAAGYSDTEIAQAIPDAPLAGQTGIQSSQSLPKGSHTVAEYIGQQRYQRLLQLEKLASNPGLEADVRTRARAQLRQEFGDVTPEPAQSGDLLSQLQASVAAQGQPTQADSRAQMAASQKTPPGIAEVPNDQIKERPELFQGRDADPGLTYNEGKVRSIVENYDPIRAEPGLLVRDTSTGELIVVRGHHRLEAAKRLAAAGEAPNTSQWQIVDANLSDPKQVAELRKQALLSNYGSRATNVREDLRAVKALAADGADAGSIASQMGIPPAQADDYLQMATLPQDIIDKLANTGSDYGNVAEVARVANTYKLSEAETRALVARYGPGGQGAKISRPQVRDALEMFAADFRSARASQAQMGFDPSIMGDANVAILDNIDRMVASQAEIRRQQLALQRTNDGLKQFASDPEYGAAATQLQDAIRQKVKRLSDDLASQKQAYNDAKLARLGANNGQPTGQTDQGAAIEGGQAGGNAPQAGASLFDLGAIPTKPAEPTAPAMAPAQGLGGPSSIAAMSPGTQAGAQASTSPVAALEHGTEYSNPLDRSYRPPEPRAPWNGQPPNLPPSTGATEPPLPGMEPPKASQPLGQRAWTLTKDVLNVPRATLASFDVSNVLRQNYLLGILHPGYLKQSIVEQFKAMASEEGAKALAAARQADPDYQVLKDAGWFERQYGIAAVGKPLENRDERFMTALIGKIPGFRASERGFSEGVNSITWNVSKDVLAEMRAASPNGAVDAAALGKRIDLINALAGRGKVPKAFESAALNATFFSPRFFMSRLEVPAAMLSRDPAVRMDAAKAVAGMLAVNGTILAMAAAAGKAGIVPGLSVGTDPARNFGKVSLGDTSYDFWAGYAPIARFVYQLATNDAGYGQEQGKLSTIGKFARGKLAPVPAAVVNALKGQNPAGDTFENDPHGIADAVYRSAAPIFLQNVADQLKAGNVPGALKQAPDLVGISTNTFTPRTQALDDAAKALAATNTKDYPDGVSGFYDLNPKDRQAIKDQNPKLWQDYTANATGPSAKAEALRVELQTKQQTLDDQLLSGQLPADQWQKQYQALRDELRYRTKQIYDGQSSSNSNLDPRLQTYFGMLDAIDKGTLTWDDVDAWMAKQPAADQKFIQDNTGLGGTPLVRAFKQYQQQYYDLPKYVGYTADEAAAIDQLASYARSYATNQAGQLAALNVIARKNAGSFSGKVVSAVRRMLIDSRLGPREDPRRAIYRKTHAGMAALMSNGYLSPVELNQLKRQIGAAA